MAREPNFPTKPEDVTDETIVGLVNYLIHSDYERLDDIPVDILDMIRVALENRLEELDGSKVL